jgi:hypothetical protein
MIRPILTYSGQGLAKSGVHEEHHAIIYSSSQGPIYFDGEAELSSLKPIQCRMTRSQYDLDPSSRLNFAKVYTVEHDIKVWFIGRVHENSVQDLMLNYDIRHPRLLKSPMDDRESTAVEGNVEIDN